jgi:ubiquitin carboxyl-terminal hydrolase 5/13
MDFCLHSKSLKLPVGETKIYKDECTLCFKNDIKICTVCYDGSCSFHSELHHKKTAHNIYLGIQKIKKENKIQKLEIKKDEYKLEIQVECKICGKSEAKEAIKDAKLLLIIQAVVEATSAKDKSQIKSWEQEIISCNHTRELVQESSKKLDNKCGNCDLKENLWACMICGNLGCGRAQFGGVGGNGHGLQHFEATGHPVAVKLGTITQDGQADVFCYSCGEERIDEDLVNHLMNFGIRLDSVQKTEKSLGEMQLEQNLKFDFSMTTQDGKNLLPLFGPGLTGLKNLGNSCYMASIVQVLFSIPSFYSSYYNSDHHLSCNLMPAECFHCQMEKMANGLLSGDYSCPIIDENNETRGQNGVSPFMFKDLIGKGHSEFSSMRQQDAQEFLQHILSVVEQKEKRFNIDPTSVFKFQMEQKLKCFKCKKVRYRKESTSMLSMIVPAVKSGNILENGKPEYLPVEFNTVLERYFGADHREFTCPFDNQKTEAVLYVSFLTFSTSQFYTFPDVLVCSLSRFTLGEGWVMEKLSMICLE